MKHRRTAACALALFATSVAGAAAEPASGVPTLAVLRERIRTAIGNPPPASRETETITRDGATTQVTILRSGADERRTFDSGPLHSESGTFHGRSWFQDLNGETIGSGSTDADERADGLANESDGAFAVSVVPVTDPVSGYTLSSLDRAGFGTREFVDGATWRIVRKDDIRPSGTVVTRYDDFRTVDGYTVPYHWAASDGRPEDDAETRVISYVAQPVASGELAIPPARRTLVEFPAGKPSVALPVHEEHHRFVVRVYVGTRGLDFLVDSGAAGIVLEQGVAKSLGLPELRSYLSSANAGRFRGTTTIVPDMHVGDLALRDVVVETVPSLAGRDDFDNDRVVGLLGFDFLADVALKLDYVAGTATAFAPATFVPPVDANGFAVDLRLGRGVPATSVTVNGAVGRSFFIDTGAYGSLILFDRFARRNPSALVDEGGGANRNVRLVGVGGEVQIKPYQLKLVTIGGVNFHDFVAYDVVNRRQYDLDMDGTIGPSFLQIFDLYFDYAHAKAYFVFNAG